MGLVFVHFFSREMEMCVRNKGCGVVVYGAAGCVVARLPKAYLRFITLVFINRVTTEYRAVKIQKILGRRLSCYSAPLVKNMFLRTSM